MEKVFITIIDDSDKWYTKCGGSIVEAEWENGWADRTIFDEVGERHRYRNNDLGNQVKKQLGAGTGSATLYFKHDEACFETIIKAIKDKGYNTILYVKRS